MPDTAISVVIASYNRAHLVGRAIDSALAAMSLGDEMIVADDGSTDNTQQVLAQYGSRIRCLRIPHSGVGAARNYAVRQARNPLVAFLDDDEWMPDKLQLQRAVMHAHPEALFCFSDFTVRDPLGHVREHNVTRLYRGPCRWEEVLGPGTAFSSIAPLPAGHADFEVHVAQLYTTLLEAFYVLTSTVIVRHELAGAALRFEEDLPTHEDWVCYARLAKAGPAAYLACSTACQDKHAGPRVTDADDYTSATAHIAVLERIWGADEVFLERQGGRLRQALAKQHRVRAGWLLRQGRMREAREEFRLAGEQRLSRRMLACLPGPLAHGLFGLWDMLRCKNPRPEGVALGRPPRGGR